jgi:hypothetical protein
VTDAMIELRRREEIDDRAARAGLRIVRRNDALYPRMQDRAGASRRARSSRKARIRQAIVAKRVGIPECGDFRVRRGIELAMALPPRPTMAPSFTTIAPTGTCHVLCPRAFCERPAHPALVGFVCVGSAPAASPPPRERASCGRRRRVRRSHCTLRSARCAASGRARCARQRQVDSGERIERGLPRLGAAARA